MPDAIPSLDEDLYAHLHALAARIYAERGFGHPTLQPTALLHEAWVKLARSNGQYESRAHFVAVAARAMRQILVDRAAASAALKRGGPDLRRDTLSGVGDDPSQQLDILALNQALDELALVDARAAEVAQLRTFGGLTVQEVAEAIGASERTVDRSWRFGRAFLAERMG